MIVASIFVGIGLSIVSVIYFVFAGFIVAAIVMGIITLLWIWFYYSARKRIVSCVRFACK